MIVDRYYYWKLSALEKKIYKEIYHGCMEQKDVIPVTPADQGNQNIYERVMQAVVNDNPLLYYVNQSTFSIASDTFGNAAIIPQYFFSSKRVSEYSQKIQEAVNRIIYDLKLLDGDDIEKVRRIHDYMCAHVSYDHEGSDLANTAGVIASHNIIGVLAHNKAQCEGIAKTVKVLLNAVDIPLHSPFWQSPQQKWIHAKSLLEYRKYQWNPLSYRRHL